MNITLQEQAMLTTILSQPYRTYHNITHINDCLTELAHYKLSNNDSSSNVVENAIWYHDVIYNPYNPPGENERQSAEAFFEYKPKVLYDVGSVDVSDWDFYHNVRDAILLTAHHTNTQPLATDDYDIKLMLDIDLAGLGKNQEIFYRNSINIMREYYNTSGIDIMKGRLKFLSIINERDTFYYTEYFQDKYHRSSKDNVNAEIKLLNDSIDSECPEEYFYYIQDIAGEFV